MVGQGAARRAAGIILEMVKVYTSLYCKCRHYSGYLIAKLKTAKVFVHACTHADRLFKCNVYHKAWKLNIICEYFEYQDISVLMVVTVIMTYTTGG